MGKKGLISLSIALVILIGGVGALVYLGNDDESDTNGSAEDTAPEPDEDETEEIPEANPKTETVAEGFDQPWALAFLPDSEQLLVTEVSGDLSLVDTESGDIHAIDGVPEVNSDGQGGLLDVTVAPDFNDSPTVYLTYSANTDNGNPSTHLASAQLDVDDHALDNVEELYVASPASTEPVHFGSRVEVGPDGNLYMSIGDRGDKNFDDHISQDPSNVLGTTVRLAPDGSVPDDNPFIDDDEVADEIYTYGHRNVQGMAFHPETDELWHGEHGENDGDAIHLIRGGNNYGWPIGHTGCEYGTDIPVGVHPSELDDVVDPIYYWECGSGGFPPAGMTFYDGDEFPAWQGDLLIGSLASEYLARFTVDGEEIEEAEALLDGEGWRLRDVAVGPVNGAVYVAFDEEGTDLVRLVNE